MPEFDAIVLGGGISGASIAWQLAADRRVVVVERERQLGYHATGRSAAMFVETIGNAAVRALSTASRAFLDGPPFGDSVLSPRPVLHFSAARDAATVLARFYDEAAVEGLELITGTQARRLCPILAPSVAEPAVIEPNAMAIDVHALHQGFLRGLRERGAVVVSGAGAVRASFANDRWTVASGDGQRHLAPIVVNAAGAWCDELATAAGVRPIGIRPLRRTMFSVAGPDGVDPVGLPFLAEVDDLFYLKPEPGQFLCSPADETPHPPGDARADELEIARALDVLHELTTITSRHVRTSWAGLRSFSPDRLPVVGFDPAAPGFFWYVGQGGFGVQTSPALSCLGAALVRGEQLPAQLLERGLTRDTLAPTRPALLVER